MNVLFIGATGRVGSQVVPFLQPQFELTLAAYSAGEVGGLPVVAADICNWEETATLLAAGTTDGAPFDAVVYCATADYRDVHKGDAEARRQYFERCIEVNARGAYHVFEAAHRAGVQRVVHVGSLTAMLGAPRYEYIGTDALDRPSDLYASTKIFGENVGRSYVFRPRHLGPDPDLLETPMRVICLRLGHPFESEAQWWASRFSESKVAVATEDIARAMTRALLTEVRYGVYPVVSQVDETYIDPALYAELGYEPTWLLSAAAGRWIRRDAAHAAS
jgi:NAD(P)-dependent dehydrogenase (short-subunit alcohol dehydrogenase family)